MSKTKVSFIVTDENRQQTLNPDEISKRLGIRPSTIIRKGEPIPGWRVKARVTSWVYDAPLSETSDVGEQLSALKDHLIPHKDELKGIADQWSTAVSIVIEEEGANINLWLDKAVIDGISELSAGLWIDTYVMD